MTTPAPGDAVHLPSDETTALRLEADEVHLWWGSVEAVESLDAARGWLSDEERHRGERFRRERDARAFCFRRAFRRWILARYVGVAPRELAFDAGADGKPFLVGAEGPCFSASCSGEHVLVGVTRARPLGVDVERGDPRLAEREELSRLARRVLSAREQRDFGRMAEDQREPAFLRAWARKEAWLKASGIGLAREPATLHVGLEPRQGERLLAESPFASVGARSLDLAAPPACAASLVVAAHAEERLRYRADVLRLPGGPTIRAR